MNKVSISDFVIAIFDLVEAEGRTFRDTAAIFIQKQQINFKKIISQSSWMIGLIFIAIICILGAIVFFIYGCYELFLIFLPAFVVPFAIAVLLLILAGIFSYFALLKIKNADK
jgi:hypothetical protein